MGNGVSGPCVQPWRRQPGVRPPVAWCTSQRPSQELSGSRPSRSNKSSVDREIHHRGRRVDLTAERVHDSGDIGRESGLGTDLDLRLDRQRSPDGSGWLPRSSAARRALRGLAVSGVCRGHRISMQRAGTSTAARTAAPHPQRRGRRSTTGTSYPRRRARSAPHEACPIPREEGLSRFSSCVKPNPAAKRMPCGVLSPCAQPGRPRCREARWRA